MAFDSWPVKAKKYSFEETSECGTRRAFDSWPVKKKKYSFEEISECRSRLASDSWKGSPHEEDCSAHQIINTFMMPKLYAAATTGDVGEFEKVVNGDAERTPIEDVTPRGNSVLHIAASFGHDGIVNFILQNCPKLFEFENHKGDLALHVAASSGYLTVVKSLVSFAQKAAPTESPNTLGTSLLGKVNLKGNTALHVALENCQRETALFLVQADPQVSHCPNWEGKSPFYMAAKSGYLEIVESIITVVRSTLDSYNQGQSVEHEADSSKLELNYLNDENHNASVHPNLEGYRLLHASIIGRNKDVMGKIWSMDSSLVYSIDENGLTPLSLAASIGFIEGVCYILDNSTDSTYQTDREGFFPIHRACMGGHIEIIDVFLKRHPDSAELLNNGGENILHVAAKNGRAKLVSWMLELSTLDMLINEKDEDGFTPLHWAAQNCHPKVVSILTSDKRVNLEIMNNRGLTALDIAEKNIDSSAPFRNRLTRTALKSANAPRSEKAKRQREINLVQANSFDISPDREWVNTLLLVASLVATGTYACGFTLPGGNKETDPNSGMASMVRKLAFQAFLISNTIAMYSSIVVAVTLIWAQFCHLNEVIHSLRILVLLLGVALTAMSSAFICGVYVVVNHQRWLAMVVLTIGSAFTFVLSVIFFSLGFPAFSKNRVVRYIMYYPFELMILASRSDVEKVI